MLSKKPAILLSSYTSLPSHCYTPAHPRTSCRHAPHTRHYAQHASDASDSSSHPQSQCDHVDLSWPDPTHPHTVPTPYQILSARRGDVYTKHRFYALAKLYHPDRCHASSPVAHLSHAVRLERYRLIVTAHSILADDTKRRAYDLWGSGWVGHHHSPSSAAPSEWRPDTRAWPSVHDPMYNATWEDWERWYQREYQKGQSEEPRAVYMSNFGFMSLIFALVTLGGIMQGTRANMLSSSVMEHRDRIHKEASMELARSKRATMTGDRNERIRTFLEHREATLTGEDAYQRLLPPTETCASDSARKQ